MHDLETRMLLRHHLEMGTPKAELSRRCGVSRRTIHYWVESGQLDRDLEAGAAQHSPRPSVVRKLDPYKGIIRDRLGEFPKLSAQRLFEEVRAAGYPGGHSRVRDYVREVRPGEPLDPAVRFETPPGRQGQVDFGSFRLPWGHRHALLVVLGHSRLLWLRFFPRQTMEVLLCGLEGAFERPALKPLANRPYVRLAAAGGQDAGAVRLRLPAERQAGAGREPARTRLPQPAGERRPARPAGGGQDPSGHQPGHSRRRKRAARLLRSLAGLIESLDEAKAASHLARRLKVLTHPALLVVDEIGYLPVSRDRAVLFFQLINARHEQASTVLTSNKGFEEWGAVLGDEVMAAALIDRLLHHCHIVNIRGNSYRMREHRELRESMRRPEGGDGPRQGEAAP